MYAAQGTPSLYAMAIQKDGVISRTCGVRSCGSTFPSPKAAIRIITTNPDKWKLDIGGYCPKHRMHRCPKHARLSSINSVADSDVTVYTITTCCSDCGKVLDVAP